MKYTIQGERGDGTVYLEMKKPKGGSVSCRYMFADIQGRGKDAGGLIGACRRDRVMLYRYRVM
jgi:hypothetical protein